MDLDRFKVDQRLPRPSRRQPGAARGRLPPEADRAAGRRHGGALRRRRVRDRSSGHDTRRRHRRLRGDPPHHRGDGVPVARVGLQHAAAPPRRPPLRLPRHRPASAGHRFERVSRSGEKRSPPPRRRRHVPRQIARQESRRREQGGRGIATGGDGAGGHYTTRRNEPLPADRVAVLAASDRPARVRRRIRLRARIGHRRDGAGDLDGADDRVSRRSAAKTSRRECGDLRLLRRRADRRHGAARGAGSRDAGRGRGRAGAVQERAGDDGAKLDRHRDDAEGDRAVARGGIADDREDRRAAARVQHGGRGARRRRRPLPGHEARRDDRAVDQHHRSGRGQRQLPAAQRVVRRDERLRHRLLRIRCALALHRSARSGVAAERAGRGEPARGEARARRRSRSPSRAPSMRARNIATPSATGAT